MSQPTSTVLWDLAEKASDYLEAEQRHPAWQALDDLYDALKLEAQAAEHAEREAEFWRTQAKAEEDLATVRQQVAEALNNRDNGIERVDPSDIAAVAAFWADGENHD